MNESPDLRFFPLIFDSIPHGIFTIDAAGRITSFNRTAEKLTGYDREDVLGRACAAVFQADICETSCPLKRSIHTFERTQDREVTIVTKSGRKRPIAISTAALVSPQGEVLGGVEMFRDLSTVHALRKQLHGTYVCDDIVSKSPKMQRIFELIPLVASSQSTVLIEGASGTGKELVARAIHNQGPRHDKPFVAVNCAALPESLMESELFGYRRGAFTDAKADKPGRFELANGGTILLDEVGELPQGVQAKLLRVLQQREYEPLGATAPVKADVRVIASTNRDLEAAATNGDFRQDLYFRLAVVRIQLPPLTERREDIPLLTRHFIDRFNALQGRRIRQCSERALSALMSYPFPGNVRELENAIEHAFVVCVGEVINLEDLPIHIVEVAREGPTEPAEDLESPLEAAEAETIRSALERNDGNRAATAGHLGISRSTLWRKMKRYGIE
jgi:PAS domain S-box-containing protein